MSSHDLEVLESQLELQFKVLTLDYERTLGLLDGVTRVLTTVRATGATVTVAFLSVATERGSPVFAVAAAVLLVALAGYDVRQSWLYSRALRRANRIERLFQHRLAVLARPYDEFPAQRLGAELERYEFGALGQLPRFHWRGVPREQIRPRLAAYGSLTAIAFVAAFVV